jgi:hypothetical protein
LCKKFVLARSDAGSEPAAAIYILIRSAKLNDLAPMRIYAKCSPASPTTPSTTSNELLASNLAIESTAPLPPSDESRSAVNAASFRRI